MCHSECLITLLTCALHAALKSFPSSLSLSLFLSLLHCHPCAPALVTPAHLLSSSLSPPPALPLPSSLSPHSSSTLPLFVSCGPACLPAALLHSAGCSLSCARSCSAVVCAGPRSTPSIRYALLPSAGIWAVRPCHVILLAQRTRRLRRSKSPMRLVHILRPLLLTHVRGKEYPIYPETRILELVTIRCTPSLEYDATAVMGQCRQEQK